jgi:predicted dehydrogenase
MKRRDFIKTSAIAAGSMTTPYSLFACQDKIKLAILGTGWWGTDELLPNALDSGQFEIAGLCDVESQSLQRAADAVIKSGGRKPDLFSDYQEMYEMPGLQAVAIATPTHWHALQFIDACRKGLHVFLEKPISYDIAEGMAMLEAKKKANTVVQVDFPRTMVDTNDRIKKIIQSGKIGKIFQVQANINRPDAVLIEKQIPESMDFETYCGPAPITRYLCSANGTKPNWRGQREFSRGLLMDWGIHYIHNIRKVLDLDLPEHVCSIGGITRNFTQNNPDHLNVHFDFGGLPVYWMHKSWGYTAPIPDYNIGVYYYGEKGTIFAGDLGWHVLPADGKEKITNGDVRYRPNEPGIAEIYANMIIELFNEFADGIRKRSNDGITNNLEEAFKTTSTVIYGDLAYKVKSGINIDTSNMDISNSKDAQKMLKRDYRPPYQHPYTR